MADLFDQVAAQQKPKDLFDQVAAKHTGGGFLEETVTNPLRQVGSAGYSLAAGGTHLTANIAHLLDKATDAISEATGAPRGGLFEHIENWAREQQHAQEQKAAELHGGRTDIPSQIYRGVPLALGQIPVYGVASHVLGPAAGMGAISALEESDKGPRAALEAGVKGALMGKAFQAMGPASRPVRAVAAGGMTAAQGLLSGEDPATALVNAGTMGGLNAMGPGGVPAREIFRPVTEPAGRAADAVSAAAKTAGATKAATAIKGAVVGGAKAAVEPGGIGRFKIPVPAPIAGAWMGGKAATELGLSPKAGAIVGGASPIVRGAFKGAKAALAERAARATAAPSVPGASTRIDTGEPIPAGKPIEEQVAEEAAARRPAPTAAPETAAAPVEDPVWEDLAQQLAKGQSYKDLSEDEQATIRQIAEGIEKGKTPPPPSAGPPPPPAGPPPAGPAVPAGPPPPRATTRIDTGPALPPSKSLEEQVADEAAARRAQMQPAAASPAAAAAAAPVVEPPAVAAKPKAAAAAQALADEMQQSGTAETPAQPEPLEAPPLEAPPSEAPRRSLAQVEAAMARKGPAPLPKGRSPVDANGEPISPEMQRAQEHGRNRTQMATRIADALRTAGIDYETAATVEHGVLGDKALKKGAQARWGNIAHQLGEEREPSPETVKEILAQLRQPASPTPIEAPASSTTTEPEAPQPLEQAAPAGPPPKASAAIEPEAPQPLEKPAEPLPGYNDALRVVREAGKASTSMLQRKLRLGYGAATQILNRMEQEGIVGPAVGAKPRQLLQPPGEATAPIARGPGELEAPAPIEQAAPAGPPPKAAAAIEPEAPEPIEQPAAAGGGAADRLQAAADAALGRVRKRGTFRGTKLNAMPPLDDLADMATWGAAKIAKGTVDFATWSREMIADAGAQIRPHLEKLYDQAHEIYARYAGGAKEFLKGEAGGSPFDPTIKAENIAQQSPLEAAIGETERRTPLESAVQETEQRSARELTGVLAPSKDPVRGLLSKELTQQQRGQLTPEQLDRLGEARRQNSAFGAAAPFMTPQEAGKAIAQGPNIEAVDRLLRVLPTANQLTSVAKFGEPKRGWYRASTQAIMDVFGKEDAPRFASLLASMSPQTSVESNLLNALNTWKNWTGAGRPTGRDAIISIMGDSVQGEKGEESVLGAWRNNAVRALSSDDPLKTVLSGPKVDSFYRNLADDVYRVTNDAWMASGMGVNQENFAGSASEAQLARGDPGLSPGYIATNARMRQAAQQAGIHPSEAQEALWSVYMPLYEMQRKTGMPARELLDKGLITPDVIRGTPDFSTLLKEGEYRRIMEQAGYGPQLEAMKEHQWPTKYPDLSPAEQRQVDDVAKRLEELQVDRERESRAVGSGNTRGFFFATPEYVPGKETGHLEDVISQPFSSRKAFTGKIGGAFEDVQGKDVLHKAVGVPGLEGRSATGAWVTDEGGLEVNPSRALGGEVPITSEPNVPERIRNKLQAAEAVRGAMTAQRGMGWNAQAPAEKGQSLAIERIKQKGSPAKAPPEAMTEVATKYLRALKSGKMALADTGSGVNVLLFRKSNRPLSRISRKFLIEKLGNTGNFTRTDNISDFVDYAKEWQQAPGSREVTNKMFGYLNNLSAGDYANLDRAVRQPAGDILEANKSTSQRLKSPVREDLMNLLTIMRDSGLDGVKKALDSKAFLPAIIGAAVLPIIQKISQRKDDED